MDIKHGTRQETMRCKQEMLRKGGGGKMSHWHGNEATGVTDHKRGRRVSKKKRKYKKNCLKMSCSLIHNLIKI